MRGEDVHIAADVFLFEGPDEEGPEVLERQVAACFGCDFHDGLGP